MINYLFDTLQRRVKTDLKEKLYSNKYFKRQSFNCLKRFLIWAEDHFFGVGVTLFIFFVMLFVVLAIYYDFFRQFIPSSIHGLIAVSDHLSEILVAQITLLGLIFPLVIAFTGNLIQQKSSHETIWRIYRKSARLMLLSSSSFSLVCSYLLFIVSKPWMSHYQIVSASLSIILWFFINILLLLHFLRETIDFLQNRYRKKSILQYVLNVAIPADIGKRLAFHYANTANENGLLENNKNVVVKIFRSIGYTDQIILPILKPMEIVNVRYCLLNLAIKLQLLWSGRVANNPTLCFPFYLQGAILEGYTILAESEGCKFNWVTKFLIRKAIKIKSKKEKTSLSVQDGANVLFSEVEDAIKNNNINLFAQAKDDLVQFYSEIANSLEYKNSNGNADSFLLLCDEKIFGINFLDSFINAADRISDIVIGYIPNNPEYYRLWLRFYIDLFAVHEQKYLKGMATTYMDGFYYTWSKLMSWINGLNTNESLSSQLIDSAIKQFVGYWERWRYSLIIDTNYLNNEDVLVAISHYISNTGQMIVCAAKQNNWEAMEWAVDMLIHWNDLFSMDEVVLLLQQKELITIDNISSYEGCDEIQVAATALKNYWVDVRCLVAAYLIKSLNETNREHYKNVINALLKSERLRPTGTHSSNSAPFSSVQPLIISCIRQGDLLSSEQNYSQRLETQLRMLSQIAEPEWVMGRPYMTVGTKYEAYSLPFYKIVGVGLATEKSSLNQTWLSFINSREVSDSQSLFDGLNPLNEIDDSLLQSACDVFGISIEQANANRDNFISYVGDIATPLNNNVNQAIIESPIDRERLQQLGVDASNKNFTRSDGPFPVFLFKTISPKVDFERDLYNFNCTAFPRDIVMENSRTASGIGDELNKKIRECIESLSIDDLYTNLEWQDKKCLDPKFIIKKVVEDAKILKAEGYNPILLVGSSDLYCYIDALKYGYASSQDKESIALSVETDSANGYICHLGGIEVYKLKGHKYFNLLLPKEIFKSVEVKDFGDDRYFQLKYIEGNDDPLYGTLSISLGIHFEYDQTSGLCFKYILNE